MILGFMVNMCLLNSIYIYILHKKISPKLSTVSVLHAIFWLVAEPRKSYTVGLTEIHSDKCSFPVDHNIYHIGMESL
jgi:hypothetical protein